VSSPPIDLLQGTLDVLVLKTLSWGARHGYAIARALQMLTDDVLQMSGTTRDPAVDKAVAKTVDEVTRLIESHRLNVAIARFHELVNAMRKAADSTQPAGSLRDGISTLAVMLGTYAPYTAEEVWSRLGHDVEAGDSVHDTTWPTADPALLVDDAVTCVVQVAGKVRDKLEVPPDISEDDLRALALASPKLNLGGVPPKAVIVRAPKLVNVVPG